MRIKDFLTTAILALTIICFGGENCAIQSTATDSSVKAAISTSIDTTESDTLSTDTTEESESETVEETDSTFTEGESSIAPTPIEAPETFIPSETTNSTTAENSTGAAAATSDTRLFTDSTNGISTVCTTSGTNGESQTTFTSTTAAATTTQTTIVTTRPATTTTKKLTAYTGDAPKTGDGGSSNALAGIALGAAVLTFLGFFGKKD